MVETAYRERVFLETEYVHKGRSAYAIGLEIGRPPQTVRSWLRGHGIAIRPDKGGGFARTGGRRGMATGHALTPQPFYYQKVMAIAARLSGFSVEEISARSRRLPLNDWRHAAWAVLYRNTNMAFRAIGRRVDRHYTTVAYAVALAKPELVTRIEAELAKH